MQTVHVMLATSTVLLGGNLQSNISTSHPQVLVHADTSRHAGLCCYSGPHQGNLSACRHLTSCWPHVVTAVLIRENLSACRHLTSCWPPVVTAVLIRENLSACRHLTSCWPPVVTAVLIRENLQSNIPRRIHRRFCMQTPHVMPRRSTVLPPKEPTHSSHPQDDLIQREGPVVEQRLPVPA